MKRTKQLALVTIGLLGASALSARADEGMWPYNDLPKAQIQHSYGVTLSDA